MRQSGEWVDKPNYFSVTVWGAQGENCARFLSKGRPVCIDGRLDWREWQAQDGTKRESVEIVAESVQFLGGRDENGGGGGGQGGQQYNNGFAPHSDVPADTSDFAPQPVGARPRAGGRRHPVLGARAVSGFEGPSVWAALRRSGSIGAERRAGRGSGRALNCRALREGEWRSQPFFAPFVGAVRGSLARSRVQGDRQLRAWYRG